MLACSEPPKRHARWTLRLLADRMVELGYIEDVSHVTVRDWLKVLVTDNLNTHTLACPYERFEPARARRIASKLEWRHTPEHGSWLNIAECELSVLARQCLDWRIPTKAALDAEAAAWQTERNAAHVTVD